MANPGRRSSGAASYPSAVVHPSHSRVGIQPCTSNGTAPAAPGVSATELSAGSYEEAVLRLRLEHVKRLKLQLAEQRSVAAQTVAAYSSVLDEVLLDAVLEVHRDVKTGVDTLEDLEPPTSSANAPVFNFAEVPNSKTHVDVFGQQITQPSRDRVTCNSCGRTDVLACKFAQHLEKCMGKGGRNASRSRRSTFGIT